MEQAISFDQKYFYSYGTSTLLIFHQNRTEEPINLRQKYFHSYDTYTLIIFRQNQKEQVINLFLKFFLPLIPMIYLDFIKTKKSNQ